MGDYCIPDDYIIRPENEHWDDTPSLDEHQLDVYMLAKSLWTGGKVLDIGCGSGFKLVKYFSDAETIGLDIEPTLSFLIQKYPNHEWRHSNFDDRYDESFDVVICSDVIEHVQDPDHLMSFITALKFKHLVISTPDRDALVAANIGSHKGPPLNKTHIREWTRDEFSKYLSRFVNVQENREATQNGQMVHATPKVIVEKMQEPGVIPDIIHFVWVGSPIPYWAADITERWKRMNPEYKVMLHGEEALIDRYSEAYRKASEPCSKADLIRLSALRRFGGWYFDIDFVPLRPMSELVGKYGKDKPFLTRQWDHKSPEKEVANGVIGVASDDPQWALVDQLVDEAEGKTIERTSFGPLLATQWRNRGDVTIGEQSDFYPVAGRTEAISKYQLMLDGAPESLAGNPFVLHLWAGSKGPDVPKPKTFFPSDMAIVGNSSCEKGKGRGEEIDSHNYVLRMNNFSVSEEHAADYGRRMDFWCCSFFQDIKDHVDLGSYTAAFCPFPIGDEIFKLRYTCRQDLINKHRSKMRISDVATYSNLLRIVPNPSTGITFLHWLYSLTGTLNPELIYGFGFFNPDEGHHYFDNQKTCTHKGDIEKQFFRYMCGEANYPAPVDPVFNIAVVGDVVKGGDHDLGMKSAILLRSLGYPVNLLIDGSKIDSEYYSGLISCAMTFGIKITSATAAKPSIVVSQTGSKESLEYAKEYGAVYITRKTGYAAGHSKNKQDDVYHFDSPWWAFRWLQYVAPEVAKGFEKSEKPTCAPKKKPGSAVIVGGRDVTVNSMISSLAGKVELKHADDICAAPPECAMAILPPGSSSDQAHDAMAMGYAVIAHLEDAKSVIEHKKTGFHYQHPNYAVIWAQDLQKRPELAVRAVKEATEACDGMRKAAVDVSVVIPCYNQSSYLERAIGSINRQVAAPREVIVVDDASPDNCKEAVEKVRQMFPSLTVKYVRHEENKGLSAARNTGIKEASSEWILPLDADDAIRPRMISACSDKFELADVVYTDVWLMKEYRVNSMSFDRETITKHRNCLVCTSFFKKSLWESIGGYDETMKEGYEDWNFWLSAIEQDAKFVKQPGPLFVYDNTRSDSMVKHSQIHHVRLFEEMKAKHPELYGRREPAQESATLSVIVSSYNQLRTLKLAMESYKGQTMRPKQVIIADDGSSDGTLEWIDSIKEDSYPFPVTYVSREHSWYRLASILNMAARQVEGSRILFTNADQLHCPESFEAHSRLSEKQIGGGRFVGIAGATAKEVDLPQVRQFDEIHRIQQQHPSSKHNLSYMESSPSPIGIWGGNFSVPTEMFRNIGGYDEGYDVGWGGEENNLVKRLASSGGEMIWVKDSTIYHLDHALRRYSLAAHGSKRYLSE